MTNTCTTDLRDQVRDAYSKAGAEPDDSHPFPVGRGFALNAGYPEELLASLPAQSVDAFCGVSSLSVRADIPTGATVLDLGCGSGLDSLIAARNAGPDGRVIGLDFSEDMLDRARAGAAEANVENVDFRSGPAEDLPLPDGSVDVALVNGIFNLNPARTRIFEELERVVADGGTVFASEIVLQEPGPFGGLVRILAGLQSSPDNWFA